MEYCQMLRTELPLTSDVLVFNVPLSHTCVSFRHPNL